MGWKFRKSIKILPGIRVNFGKKGYTSTTVGGKWFKTNFSKRGTRNTFSIPGTGISYQGELQKGQPQSSQVLYKPTEHCWGCTKCLMINLPESAVCEACGKENPRIKQKQYEHLNTGQPYWYCQNCFVGNSPSLSSCRSCKTINPNYQHYQEQNPIDIGKVVVALFVLFLGGLFLLSLGAFLLK